MATTAKSAVADALKRANAMLDLAVKESELLDSKVYEDAKRVSIILPDHRKFSFSFAELDEPLKDQAGPPETTSPAGPGAETTGKK